MASHGQSITFALTIFLLFQEEQMKKVSLSNRFEKGCENSDPNVATDFQTSGGQRRIRSLPFNPNGRYVIDIDLNFDEAVVIFFKVILFKNT